MTPETFLKEFGAIANAPGGVQRLREMILQLAVMGKLVDQDAEESVDDLVAICAESKKNYIKKLKLRKVKPVKRVSKKDFPFQIPKNWEWFPLDDICDYIQRGKGPKYDDSSDVKVVSQKCVRWEGFDISQARGLNLEVLEKYNEERFLIDGDLLWNSTGTGTAGRACIYRNAEPKAVADSHVTVIRAPQINGNFIWCYIASPMIQARFNPNHPQKIVSGTTNQVELSTTNVKELPVPLPPLSEQQRITAKVDQLMVLCDRLEAKQQERATLVKQARISALDELANAQSGETLQTAWKRVQDHLPMLFEHPDDVEDLKKCILQNAVMGKLIPQNPDDQPASELLKKLSEIKDTLIKTGAIKKQKRLPKIKEDEKPFEIPNGWVWCRFPEIGELARGKSKHRPRNDIKLYQNGTIPLVQTGDVARSNGPIKTYTALYNKVGLEQSRLWPKGTLCITIAANIADTGVLSFDACFPDSVVGFIPFDQSMDIEYFDFYIRTAKQNLEKFAPATAQKNINLGILNKLLIPLPPIDELIKIVAKAKMFLSFCDRLKEQLEQYQTISAQLAQSIVESITGQSTEEQEKMKAPKTELVSKLKLVKKPGAKVHAPLSAILVKNNDELSAKALWNTSGLAIDDFYRQLKTEMVNGWIAEPEKAHVRITDDQVNAQ